MLVLGPPGTGKTRVISQVANAAARGDSWTRPPQRVLITSHSNRAVDNILPRLAPDLVVVRVGNASTVTEEGRPYLLDEQARQLRGQVLAGVEHGLCEFAELESARRWADAGADRGAAGRAGFAAGAAAHAGVGAARRVVGGHAQTRVDGLEAELADLDRRSARAHRAVERTARLGRIPLLGWWARWRGAALRSRAWQLDVDRRDRAEALRQARQHLETVTEQAPVVRQALSLLAQRGGTGGEGARSGVHRHPRVARRGRGFRTAAGGPRRPGSGRGRAGPGCPRVVAAGAAAAVGGPRAPARPVVSGLNPAGSPDPTERRAQLVRCSLRAIQRRSSAYRRPVAAALPPAGG